MKKRREAHIVGLIAAMALGTAACGSSSSKTSTPDTSSPESAYTSTTVATQAFPYYNAYSVMSSIKILDPGDTTPQGGSWDDLNSSIPSGGASSTYYHSAKGTDQFAEAVWSSDSLATQEAGDLANTGWPRIAAVYYGRNIVIIVYGTTPAPFANDVAGFLESEGFRVGVNYAGQPAIPTTTTVAPPTTVTPDTTPTTDVPESTTVPVATLPATTTTVAPTTVAPTTTTISCPLGAVEYDGLLDNGITIDINNQSTAAVAGSFLITNNVPGATPVTGVVQIGTPIPAHQTGTVTLSGGPASGNITPQLAYVGFPNCPPVTQGD